MAKLIILIYRNVKRNIFAGRAGQIFADLPDRAMFMIRLGKFAWPCSDDATVCKRKPATRIGK
jgi:hypothetical protein